jgi:signal transduction histidine kinase/HAMP domain-containing protein
MTAAVGFVRAFMGSRLGRRFVTVLMTTLTLTSLLFLVFFVWSYRDRLVQENARASARINSLLEASLKNAMLKRDIEGLRAIIADIGGREDIAAVAILSPEGEIRFATDTAYVGQHAADLGVTLAGNGSSTFVVLPDGHEVLRSINPVHNEERCQACHGPVASHPVNGILVVDYQADHIRRDVLKGTLAMAAAGGLVFMLSMLAIALTLYRYVLNPVRALNEATGQFAAGNLARRVVVPGAHEIADLGTHYNRMAEHIQSMVASLQASEAFLQTLIDAVPDGIRVIADDYTILKVNKAYRQQLALTADPVGMKCFASSHARSEPCVATLVTCPLIEFAGGATGVIKARHRHIKANGEEVFVEVSAAGAELMIDGRLRRCVIESVRDLAEQAKLSHDQRLSELGQLATGVAHEIHNPLSSIQLALRAVRDDLAAGHGAETAGSYLEIANREIERCIDVSNRLLRLSEPPELHVSVVDLGKSIRDVVSLLRYQAEQAGVTVTVNVEGTPRILASESDIGMILVNLSQNAFHAMPAGGNLVIAAAAKQGAISLSLSDSGVGISKDDLERVFWPFWSKRADGSIGAGLGLSICKSAVARIGGEMTVESTFGAGTTFTIFIPDADKAV